MLERIFEKGLWSSRFFVILPVIFSLIGAIILFIIASVDVLSVLKLTWSVYIGGIHPEHFHADVLSGLIESIDLYLIAVVLLIFSFGLYELFISEIDEANEAGGSSSGVLEIHSLDQLKDKISKVIIMVLVVSFFQRVLHMDFTTPLEMLYFASSILILSLGLYFLHKGSH